MLTLALCLYLIGMMLVLSVFEVEEGSSPIGMVLLTVFWPIATLYWVSVDLWYGPEE
jgi:hypothetical protein